MLRADLKRKRRDTAAGKVVAIYRATPRKRRRYTPGRDRQVGFYGRFAGANAELKFHTVSYDDAVVATGGTLEQTGTINAIPQGVTEIQRVGRKATIKSIEWRYTLTLPIQDAVALPITGDTVRIILFQDKQCNGATATVTGGDGLLNSADIHSMNEVTNTGRFNILMDKLININYLTLTAEAASVHSQAPVVKNYHFYKRCTIPIEWNSTTGAIAEIRSNNIGVMLISSTGICGFASQFRLRFSDGS